MFDPLPMSRAERGVIEQHQKMLNQFRAEQQRYSDWAAQQTSSSSTASYALPTMFSDPAYQESKAVREKWLAPENAGRRRAWHAKLVMPHPGSMPGCVRTYLDADGRPPGLDKYGNVVWPESFLFLWTDVSVRDYIRRYHRFRRNGYRNSYCFYGQEMQAILPEDRARIKSVTGWSPGSRFWFMRRFGFWPRRIR